jgi:hypothetical protein
MAYVRIAQDIAYLELVGQKIYVAQVFTYLEVEDVFPPFDTYGPKIQVI